MSLKQFLLGVFLAFVFSSLAEAKDVQVYMVYGQGGLVINMPHLQVENNQQLHNITLDAVNRVLLETR
jgi:hypothetical protein